MRQDPDVIMVGELRDKESVEMALEAANTGHLVLGTLHTMSAKQTIERITSMYPGDEQNAVRSVLSNVLLAVVSQVLIPKFDGKGRALGVEVLVNGKDVQANIRDGKLTLLDSIMETGMAKGHLQMNKSLTELVRSGVISSANAIASSHDPVGLSDLLDEYGLK